MKEIQLKTKFKATLEKRAAENLGDPASSYELNFVRLQHQLQWREYEIPSVATFWAKTKGPAYRIVRFSAETGSMRKRGRGDSEDSARVYIVSENLV